MRRKVLIHALYLCGLLYACTGKSVKDNSTVMLPITTGDSVKVVPTKAAESLKESAPNLLHDIVESQTADATKTTVVASEEIATTAEAKTDNESTTESDQTNSEEVGHYICFIENIHKKLTIWVSYTAKGRALQVKYKGMEAPIDLVFKEEDLNSSGAYPVVVKRYEEIYEGKVNGQYEFTHAGIWDYVKYTRGRDGKVFNFTIDHDANPYGSTSCF